MTEKRGSKNRVVGEERGKTPLKMTCTDANYRGLEKKAMRGKQNHVRQPKQHLKEPGTK